MSSALYVKGKAPFVQPSHGQGKKTAAKNKTTVKFKQNPARAGAGKTSSAKNKTNVPFTQKTASMTGTSTKKNKATASFDQPNRAGKTASVPQASGGTVGKGAKIKSAKTVNPPAGKFKSIADVLTYRKKKYGV